MESKKSMRLSPLKVNRESRSIRKPPVPLPMVQSRQPVIIHMYSPKIIETDANNFMWMVQRLTGSSDTRIRCENSKPEAAAVAAAAAAAVAAGIKNSNQQQQDSSETSEDDDLEDVDDKNLVVRRSIAPRKDQILLSPTSSADSGFFGRFNATASPKSPLLGSCFREASDSSMVGAAAVYVPAAINSSEITVPWSPAAGIPTPNALSHDFLTEFSSVFAHDAFPSPLLDSVALSPHGRLFGALPSPATMAYRDLALSFIKDPSAL